MKRGKKRMRREEGGCDTKNFDFPCCDDLIYISLAFFWCTSAFLLQAVTFTESVVYLASERVPGVEILLLLLLLQEPTSS